MDKPKLIAKPMPPGVTVVNYASLTQEFINMSHAASNTHTSLADLHATVCELIDAQNHQTKALHAMLEQQQWIMKNYPNVLAEWGTAKLAAGKILEDKDEKYPY